MISNKVLLGKERVKEHLKVIFLKMEPQISYWNFSCLIICDLSYINYAINFRNSFCTNITEGGGGSNKLLIHLNDWD